MWFISHKLWLTSEWKKELQSEKDVLKSFEISFIHGINGRIEG